MNRSGFLAIVGVLVGCGSKLATAISPNADSGRDEAQPAADASLDVSVAGFDDASADAAVVVPPSSACNTGAPTSVSGKVYDPAGKNPVFNVRAPEGASTSTKERGKRPASPTAAPEAAPRMPARVCSGPRSQR
jgi:hypothetical protein